MKKILLLGGSFQQIIAIDTAKRLGLYTVLCDYLSDNPGQYKADKFYPISTTDKEAILEIAQKEHIDYIIDCCDSLESKKLLIEECFKRKIPIISCMGTGNKFHPELFLASYLLE